MKAPPAIESYLEKALASPELVKEIIFSSGTYQVEVIDQEDGDSYWPFLRFDEESLVDFFCSCKDSEETGGCKHLAAAFHRVTEPDLLHRRFQRSFWHALFSSLAKDFSYQTNALEKVENAYRLRHPKEGFFIEARGEKERERLQEILENRVKETEETSLKFSNLSIKEMQEYKEGRSSASLRFTLSFWSDLAQWFFLLQDEGSPYKLQFFAKENALPHKVFVQFSSLRFSCQIPEASWPFLVESLSTVKSPIKVQNKALTSLEKITYDETNATFFLHRKGEKSAHMQKGSIEVEGWLYTPEEGFSKKEDLLQQEIITKKDIDAFLTKYPELLREYLEGTHFSLEEKKLQYAAQLDLKKGLEICAYIFTEGDLTEEPSQLFSSHAYIAKKGFFAIHGKTFPESKIEVAIEELSEFVTNHASWLQQFEGLQTHFRYLEADLSYELTEKKELRFTSKFSEENKILDLGDWVYIKEQGFFRKKGGKERFLLCSGALIPKQEIPAFIDNHKEELAEVSSFFLKECPIESSGLHISLNEKEEIVVLPIRKYKPPLEERDVSFFANYGYIKNQGFFPLLAQFSLPEPFARRQVIPKKREEFFLRYEVERLKPFTHYLDSRLKKPQFLKLHIRSMVKERKKRKDFWIVDLYYESDIGIAEVVDVWKDIVAKKKQSYSKAGMLFLTDSRFYFLHTLGKRRLHKKTSLLQLTTIEWIRLSIFEQLEEPTGKSPQELETKKWMQQLNTLESSRLLDISDLKSTLRPYQELGLQWLWFLYCHGLSGLLCDEMGLGKTHQAMAILAASFTESRNSYCKFLVVCPTSVIYHWQDLLARFLPKLRILTYYGLERSLEHFKQDYDLLLTSYGILRTGRENLKPYQFELAIFDEIQVAKNHTSQTHQALLHIQAVMKLGLTGTPVENRLRELKAIFDIVLPGYLPSEKQFREFFIHPIEKHHDPEKKQLLQRLIKPFILRRKKAEVLLDLPEKMEEISYLDLSEEQKILYQDIAKTGTQKIVEDLEEKKAVPYVHIFPLLSKLKQVCDHPSLIHGDLKSYEQHDSAKWEFFKELIEEARASQQKVVVFSQYLGMLSIIEQYLKKKKIGFASIKGSTRNRKEQLQKFREDPHCEVFVASLLAAGVGIDLSSASIVIHYDRWWNPGKEEQATDRVHRIGQNRGVQVFKLVTKNTIEEHIHQMIDAKKHLIESSIGKDDSDQIRLLSREELMDVLKKTMQKIF